MSLLTDLYELQSDLRCDIKLISHIDLLNRSLFICYFLRFERASVGLFPSVSFSYRALFIYAHLRYKKVSLGLFSSIGLFSYIHT